jgi:hypothetical protein
VGGEPNFASNPETKEIPILAITALFGPFDLQTCIDAPAATTTSLSHSRWTNF